MTGGARRAATVVAALASCASVAWVTGGASWAAYASASASASRRSPDAPTAQVAGLEQTWQTSQGTWAVVAMGHLGHRLNTFWQMFFRPAGATRWSLVTPPGVASNGGFSVGTAGSTAGTAGTAGPSGTVVAGFQPSEYLLYSPLAVTTDGGRRWRAGTLGAPLAYSADALAAGAGGVLALVRSDGGTLLRSDRSITRWSTVATVATLRSSAAGRACGVEALTAVVVAAGAPEVATTCARRGTIGLFREAHGTWVSSAPRLEGARSLELSVVRLWHDGAGTAALIELSGAGGHSLVAAWRPAPRGSWTVSAAVRFTGDVLATATGTGSGVAVVTSTGWAARSVERIAGPGRRWRAWGRPPAGTQVVAFTDGALVALAVHDSRVSVWSSDAAGRWRETSQRTDVPIEYGSST